MSPFRGGPKRTVRIILRCRFCCVKSPHMALELNINFLMILLQGEDAEQAARAAMAAEEQRQREKGSEKTPPTPPQTTLNPSSPSPKLENSGRNPLPDLIFQQKRSGRTRPNDPTDPIQMVECVGVDGTRAGDDQKYEEEEDDYKEYYREHKASPLSEVEFVDTRVPMRQATDCPPQEYDEYRRKEVILWSKEQLDTAEEALRRAEALFRAAAESGDPDTPWGRVLAGVRRH
ncbi:hypothetical protein ACLOJK_026304 [Asimina triloba]